MVENLESSAKKQKPVLLDYEVQGQAYASQVSDYRPEQVPLVRARSDKEEYALMKIQKQKDLEIKRKKILQNQVKRSVNEQKRRNEFKSKI